MKLGIKSRRAEGGRMEVEGKHGQKLQWHLSPPPPTLSDQEGTWLYFVEHT